MEAEGKEKDRASVELVGETAARGENVRATFDMIPLNRSGTCPSTGTRKIPRLICREAIGAFRLARGPKVIYDKLPWLIVSSSNECSMNFSEVLVARPQPLFVSGLGCMPHPG